LRGAATSAHGLLVGDDDAADEAVDAATLLGARGTRSRRWLFTMPTWRGWPSASPRRATSSSTLPPTCRRTPARSTPTRCGSPLSPNAVHALRHLTRKYGPSVDDVLAWSKQAAERLRALDNDDDRLARLEEQRAELRVELGAVGAELSAAREQAAGRFAAAVTAEIAALAMPAARVELTVDQRDDPAGIEVRGRTVAFGRHGVDDVEILLAGHAGAPLRPLQKGASGGSCPA
jgi:DNA repair protein RecN (Recombination protein N)